MSVEARLVRLTETSVTLDLGASSAAHCVADVVLPGTSAATAAARLNVVLRLEAAGGDDLALYRDDGAVIERGDPGSVAAALLEEVAGTLVSHCRSGLLFHAAAVVSGDRIIVLPGRTGAGKSTLAASLVRRGLTLVGDEIAHLDERRRVRSFPRPFAFKPGGLTVARRWFDIDTGAAEILETPIATLVPPRLIGRSDCAPPGAVGVIVFPEWEGGRRLEVQPMSRAETGLRLMPFLVNARNLPGHGFAEVTRLARDIPGYRLCYSDADDVAIDALIT